GYPSKPVAIAEGVPGIFNKTADIDPPYIAPLYTPINKRSASCASIPIVKGTNIATPMVAVNPGNDPMTIPAVVPKIIKKSDLIVKTIDKEDSIVSTKA